MILNGSILIDCGVSYKKIEPYVKDLKLVLLTHIHSDHFNRSTLRRLTEERPTLRFGCGEWLVAPLMVEAGVPSDKIDLYRMGKTYRYPNSEPIIEPIPLTHDVENLGYKIYTNGERAIYATDTFTLDGIDAEGFDLYMIEANYTEDEMAERINRKLEAGEYVYEYRAAAGHLSKEKADEWLRANATPGKSRIVYLHRHEERS